MATILHFFTLPELADEAADSIVRVEGVVQVKNTGTTGLGTRTAAIHARAVQYDGTILTFMLPVGSIQTIHGEAAKRAEEDQLEADYLAAGRAVTEYLEGRGLEVLPGLIDIGGAEPVRGTWAGLEVADNGGG